MTTDISEIKRETANFTEIKKEPAWDEAYCPHCGQLLTDLSEAVEMAGYSQNVQYKCPFCWKRVYITYILEFEVSSKP